MRQLQVEILDQMRYLRGAAGLAMTAGLLGCDAVTHALEACDDVAAFGLGVSVVDGASSVSLVNGTTVFVQDGTFSDSVTVMGDSSLVFSSRIWLLPERAGTYAIDVRHAGYRDWTMSGVRIVKDGCHVTPVHVDAQLVRTP